LTSPGITDLVRTDYSAASCILSPSAGWVNNIQLQPTGPTNRRDVSPATAWSGSRAADGGGRSGRDYAVAGRPLPDPVTCQVRPAGSLWTYRLAVIVAWCRIFS